MKTLILLTALLASTAARADTIVQKLELDLDGDGKLDVATIVDTGDAAHYRLEIALTKDQKILRYDNLLRKWSGQTCGEFSKDELAAGPNGTLTWNEGITRKTTCTASAATRRSARSRSVTTAASFTS